MRNSTAFSAYLSLFLGLSMPILAEDQVVHVPLRVDAPGVKILVSYCSGKLRDAGFDPDEIPLSRIGPCMQAETEEALRFSYESQTLLGEEFGESVLNLCVDERREASDRWTLDRDETAEVQLTWKFLNECLANTFAASDEDIAARRTVVSKSLGEREARYKAAMQELTERYRAERKQRKKSE